MQENEYERPSLTLPMVADELCMSVQTVRIFVKSGRLAGYRFGRWFKVSRQALDDFKRRSGASVRATA